MRLSSAEWTAVGVVCTGLAMLGLAAGPEGSQHRPAGLDWALLGVVAAVLIVGAAAGRLADRARALALGLGAGCGFGVVEVGVRLIDPIEPMNAKFYANPALYAVAAGGGRRLSLAHLGFTSRIRDHRGCRHGYRRDDRACACGSDMAR